MRSRWLSTFTLLGGVLVLLGIVGEVVQISGHKFIFDPGQVADGHEAWYYMGVGVLMMLNGLVTPVESEEKPAKTQAARASTNGHAPLPKAAPARSAAAAGEEQTRE